MAAAPLQNRQYIVKHHGLSKTERKILKKRNKAFHTMKTKEREVGELSQSATPYLLVKNGGLMCGVKRQDLFSLLSEYSSLEDVVMLPGKSYSYALFQDVEGAEKSMTNLNGQKILCETSLSNKTLYLGYLVKKPCFQMSLLDKSYPIGLTLIKDFIDQSQETVLLKYFSKPESGCFAKSTELSHLSVEKQLKHRYVKHYGYEFLYGSNTVDIDKPLPDGMPQICVPVIDKITSLECIQHCPDQLTINEYLAGQGIPSHVDTHSAFEDGIVCLSLGAMVDMDFRHPDGRHVSVLLPRRSVLVMTEDSRYIWTHGITPRKYDVVSEDATGHVVDTSRNTVTDSRQSIASSPAGVTLLPRETRLSLTFRKVRETSCNCKFPSHCDSQNRAGITAENSQRENLEDDLFVPVTEDDAIDLEKKHVYNVYENIAEHFSGTRHSPWPKIAEFLKAQRPGSLVADVGCGNGKYLGINDQLFMSGSDRSSNLASICRDRGFQVLVCDILSLPYRSDVFDVCICIAVVHHLSTPARRLAALKELTRIVRPGGRILVSVWALEQDLKKTKLQDTSDMTKDHLFPTKTTNIQTSSNDSKLVGICSSASNAGVTNNKSDDDITIADSIDIQTSEYTDGQPIDIASALVTNTKSGDMTRINCNALSTLTPDIQTSEYTGNPFCSAQHESHKENLDSSSSWRTSLKVNTTRNQFEQQDLLVPWHYRGEKKTSKRVELSPTVSVLSEVIVDQGSSGELVFQRFYHVFKENELVDDCRKLKHISIRRSYYDRGNWCVELEKTGNK